MSTDLEVRAPAPVALSTDQLQYIAHTEFVPPGLRGNLPAILACVATGRELGIGDMVALKTIHIIDGKATFSAELMVMLVRRAKHSIVGDVKDGVATVTGTRGDNGDTMTVVWTRDMADRAGLLGKSNWKKYEDSMLWARAASQLCRMLFADCFAGATYTLEELGEEHTTSAGEPTAEHSGLPSGGPSEDEPASPAVDMNDPDIPFGDAPDPKLQPPDARYITKRQQTRLFTIASKAGVPTEPDVRDIVREFTGQESTGRIPAGAVYDGIITAIQAKGTA